MTEFQYKGTMKEGMGCPKCISNTEEKPGKLRFISGGHFASVVVFGCTKCDFRQKAYDSVSMAIGFF